MIDILFFLKTFYGRKKVNQNIKCILLPNGNESKDGFGLENDSEEISVDEEFSSSDKGIESEIEEESIEDLTESKFSSTDVPSKPKKINERKTQIECESNKRSNWEVHCAYSVAAKKVSLNVDISLTRFCSPISFFEIFVNDKIMDLIFEQTKLNNQWRSLSSSARTVKDIK